MANNNIKEFTIKINGLEQSLKSTKSLGDAFLTVDKNILKVNTSIETLKKSLADIDKDVKIDVSALIDMKKMEGDMNKIMETFDKSVSMKISEESIKEFESELNKKIKTAKDNTPKLFNPSEKKPNWVKKGWDNIKNYFSKLVAIIKEDPSKVSKAVKELLPYLKKGKSTGTEEKKEEKKTDKKDTKAKTDTKAKKATETEQKSAENATESEITKWEKKWEKIFETTKKYCSAIKEVSTAAFGAISETVKNDKEKAEAELKEATEALAKVAEEKKKSTEKINDLENKAKDARGGRAIAIQEQIATEMASNEKLAAQETQLAKKKEKAEKDKKKAESREKRIAAQKSIVEATMNIAQGVTKAWSFGPVIGPVLAALVAIAGGVQIGIMTKKMTQLADGGLLKGKRHSQGGMRVEGTNIEVEGGEYVINRQSTDQNLELVRYINSQRRELSQKDINSFFARTARGYEPPFRKAFAEGGQIPIMTDTTSVDNEQLIEAIRNIKLEPRVAVTDIIRAQESMTNVDNWVGI